MEETVAQIKVPLKYRFFFLLNRVGFFIHKIIHKRLPFMKTDAKLLILRIQLSEWQTEQ